jgi:hypothetical protein
MEGCKQSRPVVGAKLARVLCFLSLDVCWVKVLVQKQLCASTAVLRLIPVPKCEVVNEQVQSVQHVYRRCPGIGRGTPTRQDAQAVGD